MFPCLFTVCVIDKLPVLQSVGCTSFLWREVPRAAYVSLFGFKDNVENYLVFVDMFVMFVVCAYLWVGSYGSCASLDVPSFKIRGFDSRWYHWNFSVT
jgi:hypothetical protein